MKILVFSDSHGTTKGIYDTMQKLQKSVSVVIHLGDGYRDILPLEEMYPHIDFYWVAGNCDVSSTEPEEKIIQISGQKMFLAHGHTFGVKSSLKSISQKALEHHADICLFGHTHAPIAGYYGDVLVFNPGSISLPKSPYCVSYGIIDISERGVITGNVVEITPQGTRPLEFYNKIRHEF